VVVRPGAGSFYLPRLAVLTLFGFQNPVRVDAEPERSKVF